jgi:hypothetical protein
MRDGFENVTKRDGSATLNWVNESENSRLVTFAEDSGYDTNMVDRIISLAKTLTAKFADMNTKEPRLDNLPPFNPKNYILVTVQVVGHADKAPVAPVEADEVEAADEKTTAYTEGSLNRMNKDMLAAILGADADELTKAELIEAILEKQG